MKLTAVFIALLFSTFCVLAQDKNLLKVKINHKFKDTESGKKYVFQFKYDTTELLQITERPEGGTGIFLRRGDVGKFKAIVEKMIKFGDAVYKNQITGAKKEFKGEKAILPRDIREGTYIDVQEDVKTPFDKSDVRVYWQSCRRYGPRSYDTTQSVEYWDLRQLEEISKIFDEKQKEVFKKYDLLKALND